MKFFKNIAEKILHPGIAIAIISLLLTILFLVLGTYFFLNRYADSIVITMFSLAIVFFIYDIYAIIRCYKRIKEAVYNHLMKRKSTAMMVKTFGFGFVIRTTISFIINIAFALYNLALSIMTGIAFYGFMFGYYLVLSILRLTIIRGEYLTSQMKDSPERAKLKKLKIYRTCGIVLLVLELTLIPVVTMLVLGDKPDNNSLITVIIYAVYAFYKIIQAIINIIRARKSDEPLLKAYRNINLCDALLTLLSLEVSLVAHQIESDEMFSRIMTTCLGAVVILITAFLGIYMIVRSCKEIKKMRSADSSEISG